MKKSSFNALMLLMIVAFIGTLSIEAACKAFGSVAVFAFAVGTVLVAGVTLACIQIVNFNKTEKHDTTIQ
jgi:uncharacterized membrane protein